MTSAAHARDQHGHADHQIPHASFSGYLKGFILSVILTVIPFGLVMGNVIDSKMVTTAIILAIGAVQIVVHVIYFLHVDAKSQDGWTLMSFLFTATLIVIMLTGSIWIMFHLKENTHPMPATPPSVQSQPVL